ncbi:IS701 family transposase [Solwaraspora sp. WMMB762]|uniref:IS701 family transposase n=1 Tax=Solwaraspora sp. WMMB762 TaxID=3404120 RepID=UPI003B933256
MLERVRSCFVQARTWRHVGRYMSALVSRIPKRNGWTIAEHVGDATPDRTQRLLNRAVWDTEGVAGEVRRYAAAGLDTAAAARRRRGLAVGALDETGQPKHGTGTAGVKRQYMGCAGRVANGINTVHLAYVRERTGHALIAARQWIPAEQITDPDTAARTGLPPDAEFRTKGQLAIDLCTHAYADELTFDVICGDEVYGNRTELREFLEARGQAYVPRVASTFMVRTPSGDRSTSAQAVDLLVGGAGRGWQVRSAGTGSKGHRWYAWAWIATASPRHHLLVRRHLATGELAFHYCYVPEGQPAVVSRLVRAAGLRWPVEECLCATRRLVVSPTQLGGTRREVSGSEWLTRSRKVNGDKSMPGNQWPGSGVRGGALGDPRDMAKAGLPEVQSPVDVTSHPPERRLKPVSRSVAVMKHSRGNLRNAKRCPARVFKEMSGPPTSRSDVRQG